MDLPQSPGRRSCGVKWGGDPAVKYILRRPLGGVGLYNRVDGFRVGECGKQLPVDGRQGQWAEISGLGWDGVQ